MGVTTQGRRARPKRIGAMLGCVVLALVATGCVLDITNDLAGATVIDVNDQGTMLARRDRDVLKIETGGAAKTLTAPPALSWSGQYLNNDGVVAGIGTNYVVSGPVTTFPLVWDRDGTPIDLRGSLENGGDPRLVAYPVALTDTGLLLGRQSFPRPAPQSPEWRFFVWNVATPGTVTYLTVVDGFWATGINDSGVVIGSNLAESWYRVTPLSGSYAGATVEPLPLAPHGINQRGDIVGVTGADRKTFAVLPAGQTEVVTLEPHGLPVDPSLPEYGPRARINNAGLVVISQKLGNANAGLPVRYPSATTAPAGTPPERFPGLNGSTEAEVIALNNNGRAIGFAKGADGVTRPFSWT